MTLAEFLLFIPGTAILLLLVSPVVLATRFLLDEAHGRRRRVTVAVTDTRAPRPVHECPTCGSSAVVRVRRKDHERLRALFSGRRAAYLCHACGQRFLDYPSDASERRVA